MHTYCIIASMFTEHNKTIIIYMKQIKDTQYKGKSGDKKPSLKLFSIGFWLRCIQSESIHDHFENF